MAGIFLVISVLAFLLTAIFLMNAVFNDSENLRLWEISVISTFILVLIAITINIMGPESIAKIFGTPIEEPDFESQVNKEYKEFKKNPRGIK